MACLTWYAQSAHQVAKRCPFAVNILGFFVSLLENSHVKVSHLGVVSLFPRRFEHPRLSCLECNLVLPSCEISNISDPSSNRDTAKHRSRHQSLPTLASMTFIQCMASPVASPVAHACLVAAALLLASAASFMILALVAGRRAGMDTDMV